MLRITSKGKIIDHFENFKQLPPGITSNLIWTWDLNKFFMFEGFRILQEIGIAIHTKSIHKKFREDSSKITTHCSPPPLIGLIN